MRKIVGAVAPLWLLALCVASPAKTEPVPPRIPPADFAALPFLRHPILSPDGRQIVARATKDGLTTLAVLQADRPEATPQLIKLGKASVAALQWAGTQRLLLTIMSTQNFAGGIEVPFLRLIAIDVATGASRVVDPKSRGIYAGDVLYSDPTGSWALVASQDDINSYPSVKRVDLATGEATRVEKEREGVWDWYADGQGVVRLGMAYEGRRWTIWYREAPGEKLKAVRGKFPRDDDSSVDKIIFGKDGKSWIITNQRTGRFALYAYDLKTNAVGQPLYENPEVDISSAIVANDSNEPIGVQFEDDRERVVWFDPDKKALQAKLDKALPNAVNTVSQMSDDEKRVLVLSGGASNPGLYYLLDRSTAQMHAVLAPFDRIDERQLAEVKPVRYRARDGLELRAYLTLPRGRDASRLPLIVMPHGGPFARDSWTYDPFVQFLANRGYAVLQPEFRGSTGFGKDFVAKGYGEWGRKMQDDLDDGVDWLAQSGRIDPKRVCIVGISYGGYAAMWGAIRNPDRYRCSASVSGVSDVPAMLRYDRKAFAATRYFREWRTKVGGEGKADLAAISPIQFASTAKIPMLIVHGEADDNVPAKQSHAMVDALTKAGAPVESSFYKHGGHGIDNSADLKDFLERLDRFLAAHNPA